MSRPKTIATGTLFDVCDCYVLDGAVRVLSKRGLIQMLSRNGRKAGDFEEYLAALPKRYEHLAADAKLEFILPGGRVGHAVDVDTVLAICVAYDEADEANELRKNQRHLARNARRVIRAAAKVGLTALVDEATGYEAIRERGELGRLFRDELGAWEETFSPKLVARLCALGLAGEKHAKWTGGRYPRPLAKAFRRIYDLIIGETATRHLKALNPEPHLGSNHHQWLTDEVRELLKRNMGIVTFCAATSHSKREFWARLASHYRGQACLVYGAEA
jgi:hypothetical protein